MIKALDTFAPALFEYRPYDNTIQTANTNTNLHQKGGKVDQSHKRKKIKTGMPNMYYYDKLKNSKSKPDEELKNLFTNDVIDDARMDKMFKQTMYKHTQMKKTNKPKTNLNKSKHTRKNQPHRMKMSRKIRK
jgi:hypothetical protein